MCTQVLYGIMAKEIPNKTLHFDRDTLRKVSIKLQSAISLIQNIMYSQNLVQDIKECLIILPTEDLWDHHQSNGVTLLEKTPKFLC